jgi:hypothetical protein
MASQSEGCGPLMPLAPEVRRVLRKAADMIEKEGWCRGKPRHGHQRDVVNAIRDAAFDLYDEWSQWRDATMKALRAYLKNDDVSGWNDAPSRTKAGVLSALRECASQL